MFSENGLQTKHLKGQKIIQVQKFRKLCNRTFFNQIKISIY
jgi:hypothetical protein